MKVKDLIQKLKEFNPEHILIGQYKDTDGSWPMMPIHVGKVPGDNTMVVIQIRPYDDSEESP